MPQYTSGEQALKPVKSALRIRLWYVAVMLIFGIFLVRLFYLQIIRHDYYSNVANIGHIKQYEIPAKRGVIRAYNADVVVPLVLNQTLYTIYADPSIVKEHEKSALMLASALKGDAATYERQLRTKDTRYVVIARKVSKEQKNTILDKKHKGIGAQEQQYRTYPNGALAAQLLGFVNNDSKGVYGIEQALNQMLSGKPGKLKAVTDVHGVPLAANTGNILIEPVAGQDAVLTIDVSMQKQLEDILRTGLEQARTHKGSAVILDANTGAVKAMANLPSYDPANYSQVDNADLFTNASVSEPIEVGSVMKPLTAAAALDKGVVQPGSSFYNNSRYTVDGYTITNVEEDGGPGTRDIADILNLSLNTGATWLLMKMGGSNDHITQEGREAWHNYMTNHYMFGKATGIEQGYEAAGSVPDPNKGYARNLTYANTSFGQAMTATTLQMAAAYAAALNGGTYYKPSLVAGLMAADGKMIAKAPEVVKAQVVDPSVSDELQPLMENVVTKHRFKHKFDQTTYSVGGKTGTAQIADPNGGYYADEYNGSYVGFVGGDKPQYVIALNVIKPKIPGYAGSQAAQPIFGDLAHMLLDKFNVTPRGR